MRHGLLRLLVVASLLPAVAFLPWQSRTIDVSVQDPVPSSLPAATELQQFISHAANGTFAVRGYGVHKATPFGDGILVAALGAVAAGVLVLELRMKLGLRLALLVVNGLGLLTLLVGSYDAFTYRSNDFWTPRDWYIGWGNSWVHTDTKAAVGLFVVLALGLYLAWHSHTLLGRDPKGGKLRNASSNVTNGILPKKHGNIPL